MSYTDTEANDIGYDVSHTYKVTFVPTSMPPGTPNEKLATSTTASIPRQWEFYFLTASLVDEDAHIKLDWRHSPVEDASGSKSYSLELLRSADDGETWVSIYTTSITSKGTVDGSYKDTSSDLQSNHTYKYKLSINVLDADYTIVSSPITLGGSQLKDFTASRGNYSNVVKLSWDVKQVGGDETSFVIARRPLGTEGNDKGWQTIHTTSGTASTYSFEDNTALPGTYNEYRVAIVDRTNSSRIFGYLITDGFAFPRALLAVA